MATSSTVDDVGESETTIPKKRIRLNETGDERSQRITPENPSNVSKSYKLNDNHEIRNITVANLPGNIRRCDEKDAQHLPVIKSYEKDITPKQLLDMFLQKPKSGVLNHIEVFFNQYCYFHNILDGDFASVSSDVANELRRKAVYECQTFLDSVYVSKLPVSQLAEVKQWLERFDGCGQRFGKKLFNMTLKRDFTALRADNNSPLCEYDFQFLFDAFASIFGLQSDNWSEPLIWPSTLELSESTYTGKADILYCQDIPDVAASACSLEDLMQVVAVVKVKQRISSEEEQLQTITTRSDPCTSSSCCSKPSAHISERLLGQHGGELLLYYPQSAMRKKDVIFGLVVQETKVSFTALKCTSRQYKDLEKGKHEQNLPKLFVTRQYDFLKKEERIHLIRPLIELAMLQQVAC